jgi:hypothetical protein
VLFDRRSSLSFPSPPPPFFSARPASGRPTRSSWSPRSREAGAIGLGQACWAAAEESECGGSFLFLSSAALFFSFVFIPPPPPCVHTAI